MRTCRICLEDGGETFCKCSGTSAYMHEECLLKWLNVSKRRECEICKHPFIFKEVQVCAPSCAPVVEDVAIARERSVGCFLVIFSISTTVGVFFVNLMTSLYVAGFITSHVLILAVIVFFYKEVYPFNALAFMQWISTIGQGIFAFDAGAAKLQDAIIVGNLQGFCMFGAIALWLMSVLYRHCTATRQKLIMVYTSNINPLNDVVTSNYTGEPTAERSALTAEKEETV